MSADCPCGSGRRYQNCCRNYHELGQSAPTAEKLMRSRYSAYVLKLSTYLHDTWHPSTRPAILDVTHDQTIWLGMEILGCGNGGEGDSEGWVEFVARFQGGQLHERSRFLQEAGQWFYLEGDILPPLAEARTGRNDPCPCGSGRKYKKCCG